MDDAYAPQATRLHVRTSLWAHRKLIVVTAILGVLLGLAVSTMLPSSFIATAQVMVQPLDGNAYAPNQQGSDLTQLETEAQVVTSDAVHEAVVEAFKTDGRQPPRRAGLSVSVVSNAQLLQVSYAARGRGQAEATANQYAESYLALRLLRRDSYIENRRTSLQDRIDSLGKDIERLSKGDRESPQIPALQAQQTNLRLQLAALETSDADPGSVTRKPIAVRGGFYLPAPLGALSGLLLGLFIGAILALMLERKSEVLRTVDDVEHLGIAVLGTHTGDSEENATQSPYDVAFLAGTILNRRAVVPATVAVSALQEGVPVAAFAGDLAEVLAHGREGVLLIDALGTEATKNPGFTDVLFGSVELKNALRRKTKAESADQVDRVDIGRDPQNGPLLYSTSRMSEALASACESYDWVLLTGPSSAVTAGRAVVGACDHWIPIVVLGRSTREDLERGLAWARTTGVEPLGVVVVDSKPARGSVLRRNKAAADS